MRPLLVALVLIGCNKPEDKEVVDDPNPEARADAGNDLTVPVGEALTFDGALSIGESFRWAFGDGDTAEGMVVEHTYDEPGNYTAVIEVTGADGAIRTDDVQVVAYRPATGVPPATSSTMVMDRKRRRLWTVTPEADVVTVTDLEGNILYRFDTCDSPRSVAWQLDFVAVVCDMEPKIEVMDAKGGDVVANIDLPTGSRPFGVVGRDGAWWVTLEGTGQLAEVREANTELHDIGIEPRGIARGTDGSIYATRFRSDGRGQIYVWDGVGMSLEEDPGPDSDVGMRGVPNLLQSLVLSPDGGTLYVPGLLSNTARGEWRDGQALTHETTVRGFLGVIDLTADDPVEVRRKQFDDQDRALAIAISPLGNLLYVSHPGTGTIQILDAYNLAVVSSIQNVGSYVTGLEISSNGKELYVHAWLDRTITAFDVSSVSVGVPQAVWSANLLQSEPLSDEVLLGKKIFHDSFDLRMSKDGYLSCAGCHPEGRDDGQVWDFTDRGEGLRNTTSLLGVGGTDMGPLHWSGNFDEVQDFENAIRHDFGGQGFLTQSDWSATSDPLGKEKAGRSDDLDALAAYVTSLKPDYIPTSPQPQPVTEGEALFATAGCEDCHPAPLYTNSNIHTLQRYDVGTIKPSSGNRIGEPLDGLDTPTLLGTWATAPYLHDGSAKTLEDAIEAHDDVDLSSKELRDLADFVRSL